MNIHELGIRFTSLIQPQLSNSVLLMLHFAASSCTEAGSHKGRNHASSFSIFTLLIEPLSLPLIFIEMYRCRYKPEAAVGKAKAANIHDEPASPAGDLPAGDSPVLGARSYRHVLIGAQAILACSAAGSGGGVPLGPQPRGIPCRPGQQGPGQ